MQQPPTRYRYQVTRMLYNGGEPANPLYLLGSRPQGEREIALDTLIFDGEFRDGGMRCSITPLPDGSFEWSSDGRRGTAETFDEAWLEMPAYLTDPDYYEQEVFPVERASAHYGIRSAISNLSDGALEVVA